MSWRDAPIVDPAAAPAWKQAPLVEEDKYRKEARAERERILAKGGSLPEGYTRRLEQGAGIGWTDEAMSLAMTPFEIINRGIKAGEWSPYEAYRYARAREQVALEEARKNTGTLGSAVEVAGGLATGGRAALGSALPRTGAAIQQAPGVMGALGRYGGNVARGAGVGTVAGAGEGGDEFKLGERATNAAGGALVGGAIAGAAPTVLGAAGYVARPLTNQLKRLATTSTAPALTPGAAPGWRAGWEAVRQQPMNVSPFGAGVEDIAASKVAQTIARSGKTQEQIAREVADANAAGQPYIVADAIGTEGQRRLAAVAKSPGAARQWIDKDLSLRDLGRGQRAQEAVDTGLGIPRGTTGEEAAMALTQQARAASRPHYQAAEAVQPVWTPRMQQFFEHPEFREALRHGFHAERTAALAEGRPFNPRDYAITDFNAAGDPIMSAVPNMRTIHLMKLGIDRMLNKHRNPLTGRIDSNDPEVLGLMRAQQAMLREVDSLNPAYGRARAAYAGPAQVRSAIERGQDIPAGGRPEDTLRRFQGRTAAEQQGERIGLADRIATQISKGTETGPLPAYLRNAKGRQELDYLSLHQGPRQPLPRSQFARPSDPVEFAPDPLRRALDREATMRQTFQQARGGSQTAENAADMADTLPNAPDVVGVISNLASGRFMAAAKELLPAARRVGAGENEAQRAAIARMLMARDPSQIAAMAQRIADQQARQQAARSARAGVAGAAAGERNRRR